MQPDQLYVTFNIAGIYEWYDKNFPNVLQSTYNTCDMTLCSFPQKNKEEIELLCEDDFTKWFTRTDHGWRIKHHEAPCYGCGNPWCMLNENRSALKTLVNTVGKCIKTTNKQKRYRCYRDAISNRYGTLGYQQRRLVF